MKTGKKYCDEQAKKIYKHTHKKGKKNKIKTTTTTTTV